MSNIALFKSGSQLPDFLRGAEDDFTKDLAGGAGGRQISIKGGVWRMIVGGEEVAKNEDRAMNFIVLAQNPHINRTFYKGKYEEGKAADPTCWSNDGLKPDADVPEGQRQFSNCANCPQNIEGSGEGKSRACRFSKRLAVALENDIAGGVYRIQLPAKSVFGRPEGEKMPLQAYAKFLSGHGVPITGVVTEARFDTSEAVPVLKFRAVRPLTREEYDEARAAAASDDAKRAVEFKIVAKKKADDVESSEFDEPAAAPLFGGAAIPARDDADADEPVKRPSKKAAPAAPAAKGNSSDILSAWSDDDDE